MPIGWQKTKSNIDRAGHSYQLVFQDPKDPGGNLNIEYQEPETGNRSLQAILLEPPHVLGWEERGTLRGNIWDVRDKVKMAQVDGQQVLYLDQPESHQVCTCAIVGDPTKWTKTYYMFKACRSGILSLTYTATAPSPDCSQWNNVFRSAIWR